MNGVQKHVCLKYNTVLFFWAARYYQPQSYMTYLATKRMTGCMIDPIEKPILQMSDGNTIYERHWITRTYPINIKQEDTHLFNETLKGWSKEVRIETYHDVSVNNELFLKRRAGIRIMMQSFGDTWQNSVYNKPSYRLKSFIKDALRRRRKVGRAMWCFDLFSTGGYYHWITEICPRLWVASRHIPGDLPLLLPSYFLSKWKFATEFIRSFKREIILFDEREVVHVKELIFVGQTGGPFNFQPEPIHNSTELLKSTYRYNALSADNKKVYISRRKSGKRMIINEAEVMNIVKKYGYDVVNTDNMSIRDQVDLFSRTTHLVSIHGAGLSNMVFMPAGSHIVEIRHRDNNHMLTCFFTLAHTFKHAYYYSFGDDQGDSLTTELRPEDKSIHADLSMLEGILSNIP